MIDNTSQFRRDADILGRARGQPRGNCAVSKPRHYRQPNCSTIGMLVALKPIYDAVGIERINVATYQAVSGTGKAAIEELAGQTARLLNGKPADPEVYPKQIAFNVLPHIDSFQDNGYTREEMKMVWETQKILSDEAVSVNPTCVRVPVFLVTPRPCTSRRATPLAPRRQGLCWRQLRVLLSLISMRPGLPHASIRFCRSRSGVCWAYSS